MPKKEWMAGLGEATNEPMDTDELLKSKISERRRREIEREEEKAEAKHKADMAELKKKEEVAQKETEKIENKTPAPESPVKVTGEFSLGKFDYQQMMMQQMKERDELRKDAMDQAKSQAGLSEALREQLHASEMKLLETQISWLKQMSEAGASKKTFMEQYIEAQQTAEALGFNRSSPEVTDLQTRLELEKVKFSQSLELRKMARDEKRADREFQLQLRKYDDERELRKQEVERERKRDEMFATAPEVLGRVIARGVLEGGGEVGSGVQAKQQKPSHHVEAAVGDSGEIECETCGQPVAIGPTARSAVCANCGTKYPITRTAQQGATETGEGEP